MKLAFCLFKYFPYGGLQRDFLRIAQECKKRGHEIHVYTMQWQGREEPGFQLHVLPAKGLQNHTRSQHFVRLVQKNLSTNKCDLVIGFNKMPHLDIYYAADGCYQARIKQTKRFFYRLLPRYRTWVGLERSVFDHGHGSHVLTLAANQELDFTQYYRTEPGRFHLLPPGINKACCAPENARELRNGIRTTFEIPSSDLLLLSVGSGFKTKGVDRSLRAIAALPKNLKQHTHFLVIGQDNPAPYYRLAEQLGIEHLVQFLGGREDVPQFLLAADLLLHPAYHENTGTVILEALAAGLPVLTSATCGYAFHVEQARAGYVVSLPFEQKNFQLALEKMATADRTKWRENALNYTKEQDLYSMPQRAADFIERIGLGTTT